MFKKNSMEFFLGLDYYLYYFTVAVLLLVGWRKRRYEREREKRWDENWS